MALAFVGSELLRRPTASHRIGEQPYEAILHAVDERHCDLIAMASHGWHGLDKLILGSETQKILSKATTPVLVCH